jgi:RNA polymerase sigma-70 factor (ECF subfamily)
VATEAAVDEKLEQERRWIEAAKAGDLDAMRPIFEEYSGPLYATVILPRMGNAAAAEDVLRDTLATALQKLDKFQWTGRSIYAWLRQIAVNKAYDVHRHNRRTNKLSEAVARETETTSPAERQPDALLIAAQEQRENRERIDAALQKINPRYRQAIELRLIEELPREECAQRMDTSVGTFDVVFFRAVRAFRKQFGERE